MERIRLSVEEEKKGHDTICRMLDLYNQEIIRQVHAAMRQQEQDNVEWITN